MAANDVPMVTEQFLLNFFRGYGANRPGPSSVSERRGSIAFFTSYRPPVALDIYSCSIQPASARDEHLMTDGESYNYNGQHIPLTALNALLNKLVPQSEKIEVTSGMIMVSERTNNLETLHIVLRFADKLSPQVKIFNFAEVFGTYNEVRMEDNGCICINGDDTYLVYVTTKDPAPIRRQPWTSVYKTNLKSGETDRLTPPGQADLNPSVSPNGKEIAVASFEKRGGWNGEIENMKTDIYVMNITEPYNRRLVVEDGGWPTWGSDSVLFFHRKTEKYWGVFRALFLFGNIYIRRVTPEGIDAVTPAAIDDTNVAVVTIRPKSESSSTDESGNEPQYRHIEVFNSTGRVPHIEITQRIRPNADHFNPFVIPVKGGEPRVGYHRCRDKGLQNTDGDNIGETFSKLLTPNSEIGLFRVSGAFPTFSSDGSRLAFVDNEFKNVWIADHTRPLYTAYETEGADSVFSTVWNQNPQKDMLYICKGPSFNAQETVHICAIPNVSGCNLRRCQLTKHHNNAFPSTNPDGTRLVYRSTRDHAGGNNSYKNLYIMENAEVGEYGNGQVTRLTNGNWIDTHCHWSPSGDWIAFSSTRDKPEDAPDEDNGLDPGYYAVFLVCANNKDVVVRVLASGSDLSGHINHPFFSPDGKSLVVVADLAGVSVDPISLPHFLHSVRPYGDIFVIDIDPTDLYKNENVSEFKRMTHSRYENSTGTWTMYSTHDRNAAWNQYIEKTNNAPASCPYERGVANYLSIPKRCRS